MMHFSRDSKSIVIQIRSRSKSDPLLSDMDYKNKMAWVWTTLKIYSLKYTGSELGIVSSWIQDVSSNTPKNLCNFNEYDFRPESNFELFQAPIRTDL